MRLKLLALKAAILLTACAFRLAESPRLKLSATYAEKGAAYLAEGKPEIAILDLKKSLKLDPNNAAAHATLALLYEQLQETHLAAEHHRRAYALNPHDPGIAGNYGRFLCYHGQPFEGLKLLEQAASDKLYRQRWIPLTNAGECARQIGELETAEKHLREALQLNPENELALAAMAKLCLAKQEYLKARAFLQRYEALSKPSAEMLELGIKIETALGNFEAADTYRKRLKLLPEAKPNQ